MSASPIIMPRMGRWPKRPPSNNFWKLILRFCVFPFSGMLLGICCCRKQIGGLVGSLLVNHVLSMPLLSIFLEIRFLGLVSPASSHALLGATNCTTKTDGPLAHSGKPVRSMPYTLTYNPVSPGMHTLCL